MVCSRPHLGCLQSQQVLLNSAPAPFYRGYDDPWLHQGKHSSQRLHRTPLQKRSQVMLKSFEVPQIRAYDWWALALSVPGQSKRFLCKYVSLSVSPSCFPSIPCLWLSAPACPFPGGPVQFVFSPPHLLSSLWTRR